MTLSIFFLITWMLDNGRIYKKYIKDACCQFKSEANVEETMKDFFTPHINCLSLNRGKNQ